MPIQALRLDPDGDMLESLETVDISRGGMGALSGRSFYPGQRLLLQLPAPGLSVQRVCATVRCCQKAEQQYRVGLEFEQPLVGMCAQAGPDHAAATLAA
jgi:hypothetical protein